MPDLALTYTEHGDFDLSISGGDLVGDDGLNTSIIISLYTDRLARVDDKLPEARPGRKEDRRGWWGDLVREDGRARPIGSRCWLLSREKDVPEVVARVQEYVNECLSWLARAGVSATIKTFRVAPGHLRIDVARGASEKEEKSGRWSFFMNYSQAQRLNLLTGKVSQCPGRDQL